MTRTASLLHGIAAVIMTLSVCACGKETIINPSDIEGDWYESTERIDNGYLVDINKVVSYTFAPDGVCIKKTHYVDFSDRITYEAGTWSIESQNLTIAVSGSVSTYAIAEMSSDKMCCNRTKEVQSVFRRSDPAYRDLLGHWTGDAQFLESNGDGSASYHSFHCELFFENDHRCTVQMSIDGSKVIDEKLFCHMFGSLYFLNENLEEIYSGKLDYGKLTFVNGISFVRLGKAE